MATNSLNIIRGSDKQFTARITIQDPCDATVPGDPFDLTGATQIRALFPNDTTKTSDPVICTLIGGQVTILNAQQGKIQILINDVKTALLKVGDSQSFEVEITIMGLISVVQFIGILTVVDRIFPGS